MNEILDIILTIAGTVAGAAIAYLAKVAASYIKQWAEENKLDRFVTSLVAAADQMFKENDEDGSIRLDYVQGMLIEAGYDLTEAVCALIESKVFAINKAGDTDE